MKNILVNLLKKNNKIFFIIESVYFILSSSFTKVDGSKKKYPKVLQLPITYNCNSKCVMCNIWQMDHSGETTVEVFKTFMKDDLFKKVESVGINGGEPSLITNLHEYADEILKLPALKSLNIISHGFSSKPLFKNLEKIYLSCKKAGVSFHVAISLDGIAEIHNTIRGRPLVFERTTATIDEIIVNQHKYCDSYDVGCTVVTQNVDNLIELDTYAKNKNYNIKYRLGIDNKRIESDKLRDQYSVLDSTLRQSATEFFHYQSSQTKDLVNKFKYYAIFFWLNHYHLQPERLLGCAWKDEGVTLDSRGVLYYCAVASNPIGNLNQGKGSSFFLNHKNISYRQSIISSSCDNCIHDYSGTPEFKKLMTFFIKILNDRFAMKMYQIKANFIK